MGSRTNIQIDSNGELTLEKGEKFCESYVVNVENDMDTLIAIQKSIVIEALKTIRKYDMLKRNKKPGTVDFFIEDIYCDKFISSERLSFAIQFTRPGYVPFNYIMYLEYYVNDSDRYANAKLTILSAYYSTSKLYSSEYLFGPGLHKAIYVALSQILVHYFETDKKQRT